MAQNPHRRTELPAMKWELNVYSNDTKGPCFTKRLSVAKSVAFLRPSRADQREIALARNQIPLQAEHTIQRWVISHL